MVGQMVGKYRVVSRLGRGGMGTVYKAVDETLGREVAIKCLNADLGDPEVLKRFRAEAVTLARLNHPNIATLFELTEHDGEMLMVMEFVRGETFEQMSRQDGPMPVDRAARLCSQVLDALSHAHAAGIVHRDLKPANLMLTESGLVKVMDFGLARMAGTEHLTNDGFMVGTPAYMAPEQVLGWVIDGRADLYAMGVVLFRLLTSQLPFKADSGVAMAHSQINDAPTPVRELRMELPPECGEILKRALSKPPGDRYQTAEAFKAALSVLGGGSAVSPVEVMPTTSLSRSHVMAEVEPTLPPTLTPVMNVRPPRPAVGIPAKAAKPVPAGGRGRLFAAVAIGVLLIAAAATTTILVRRARAAKAAESAAVASASPAPAQAPATPSPVPPASDAPPVTASAATADPSAAVPPASPGTASASAAPVAARKGPAAPAGRGPSVAKTTTPSDPPAPAVSAPVAAPPPMAAPRPVDVPVLTFTKAKLLAEEGKSRDVTVRLDADALRVLNGEATVTSAPYRDVIGLFHSHSREPKWAGPDGTPVSVAKVDSKFGFLKVAPDWITVRTQLAFIPLRVQDRDLAPLIAGLEARTGTKVVRTR